jgi:hypothetical protein
VVDLDGTLCDSRHRAHLVDRTQKRDFKKFNELAPLDPINQWCYEIVMAFDAQGYQIVFLTGRMDDDGNREIADTWLNSHLALKSFPYKLLMRKKNDYRPDYVMKLEAYQLDIAPFFDVLFAIDDKQAIVDMWRNLGIPALHCADY